MKITRFVFENYLAMINNSVGTNMFRNYYADFDGVRRDTMNDGETSCAFYVSAVLTIFGAFKSTSSTVTGVVNKLEEAGWQKVDTPEPGDVLVWEKMVYDDEEHEHIGFYVGDEKAISTSAKAKTPIKHDWLFRDSEERKITAIYRGKHLMPNDIKIIE